MLCGWWVQGGGPLGRVSNDRAQGRGAREAPTVNAPTAHAVRYPPQTHIPLSGRLSLKAWHTGWQQRRLPVLVLAAARSGKYKRGANVVTWNTGLPAPAWGREGPGIRRW
eukprot:scaffold1343_cov130-Isochrysis_galbana.AAC.1